MESTTIYSRLARIGPAALLLFMLLVLFRNSFFSLGLWIDESVTYWVIKDSFSEVTQRSFQFQGQSPLYFWMLWAWAKIFGFSEQMLRLPSLLFLGAALIVLFKLAQEMFGEHAGIPAVMAVLGFTRVQWLLSARPYAFGFFCCLLSAYALVHLQQRGTWRGWLVFVLSSAGLLFAHSLFGAFFLVHLLLWFFDSKRPRVLRLPQLMIAWTVAVLSFLPGLLQLQHLASERAVLQFESLPAFIEVIKAYFPRGLTIAFLASIIFVRWVLKDSNFDFSRLNLGTLKALTLWYILPPILLYLFCLVTGTTIFKSRYYVWQAPALALLYAGFVEAIRPVSSRIVALMLLVAAVLFQQYSSGFSDEGWNSAARLANEISRSGGIPVVVQPGLVETRSTSWLQDGSKREYLLSPLSFYPVGGSPKILPLIINDEVTRGYAQKVLSEVRASSGKFIFVAYRPDQSLINFIASSGYERQSVLQADRDVEVRVFEAK